MIESHYQVNVSKNGRHFLRIVLPATTTHKEAVHTICPDLAKRFAGHKLSLVYVECVGKPVCDFEACV